MATPTRELTFWLAGPERRVLRAIAARIPLRWRPNHFTVLGVLAARTHWPGTAPGGCGRRARCSWSNGSGIAWTARWRASAT